MIRKIFALLAHLGGLKVKNWRIVCLLQDHSTTRKNRLPADHTIWLPHKRPSNHAENWSHDGETRGQLSQQQVSKRQEGNSVNSSWACLFATSTNSPTITLEVAKENLKCSSSWLVALPIENHGFSLHKEAFRDALCLRYGWQPSLLPTTCACGRPFTIDHALSCPMGRFPSIHHNESCDLTANLMSEVSHDVRVEPPLTWISGHVSGVCNNRVHFSMYRSTVAALPIPPEVLKTSGVKEPYSMSRIHCS